MTIATVHGWDATHQNLPHAPTVGQAGGYITGSESVVWTAADRAKHPGFVQIDQSPTITATDVLADFYDLESGAITVAEIANLVKAGQRVFNIGARPGQRWPGVYCSRSNVTNVVNALVLGGVMSCPLGVADFDDNLQKAIAEVSTASGPFPIVWRQYSDQGGGGLFDLDVFSIPWLNNVSKVVTVPTNVAPPGQWNDPKSWTWKSVTTIGVGLDGKMHIFVFNPITGTWSGPTQVP